MRKKNRIIKIATYLLFIFSVFFVMFKNPKVFAENMNPPPSHGTDNGSRFYAYDKGRLLKPVFQTDPNQVTDFWAFCLDWNRDVPNYNPNTGAHDGEFTLYVNPTIERFGDAMPTQHGGFTALQRGTTEEVYDKVKRLMYIYAKDPTNIQSRFGISSQTYWNIVSNAIYYYTNSLPVTNYTGSNAPLNAPKDAVYEALDDPNLIPEDTELEVRLYLADWRTGRGIQSLASLRILEPHEVQFSKRNIAGEEIEGASIKILKDNQEVASWTSEAGKTHTVKLKPGIYTFREETAPKGYARVMDISFEVDDAGRVAVLTDPSNSTKTEGNKLIVTDEEDEHDIQFSKRDIGGREIAGAKIQILKDNQEVASWTSEAGKTRTVKLQSGQYVFHEVSAPKGYIEVTDISFEVTKDGTINVLSDLSKSTAVEGNKLIVTDERAPVKKVRFLVDKTNESGDRLAGRFYLYHVGRDGLEEVNKANTNVNNPAVLHSGDIELKPINGQDYDEFVVRETVPPEGYLRLPTDIIVRVYLSDGRVTIANALDLYSNYKGTDGLPLVTVNQEDIDGGKQLTLNVRDVKETSMKIKKVDASTQTTLPGAKFALADSEENAKAGKFLKQVKRNEVLGDRTYVVNEEDAYYTEAKDSEKSDYIVTSDNSGIATFEHLDPKKTYYAVEIEAPSGYAAESTPIALTKENSSDAAAVVKTNAKPKFKFLVGKTDEAGNPLVGRFYFYRKSDLVNRIDRTSTDKNNPTPLHGGTIELKPAEGQNYEDFVVRETVAPAGYLRLVDDITIRVYSSGKAEVLDRDKFLGTNGQVLFNNVTDEDGHLWLPVEAQPDMTFQFTLSVQNIAETSMKIKKVDAENDSQVLSGAKFALADSEENARTGKFLKRISRTEEAHGDRTYIVNETDPLYIGLNASNKEKASYTVTTGEDGIATFEHLDPRKTYYAVEVEAPTGYALNQTPIVLTKDNASDDTAAVKTNMKNQFKFRVGKTDEAGNPLAARFYFYRKSDLVNRIDSTNTDRNNPTPLHGGSIELKPVAGQDYEDFVVRETVAPQGYLRLADDVTIRVYNSGRAEVLDKDKFLGTNSQPLFNDLTVEEDHWWLPVDTQADGAYQFTISVQNIAETSMILKKVDASNTATMLSGAKFALADSEENAKAGKFLKRISRREEALGDRTYIVNETDPLYIGLDANNKAKAEYTVTTGEDGIATFEHLDPRKTYYAVEIEAPQGYTLDKTPIALTKDNSSAETAAVKTNARPQFKFLVGKTDEAGNPLAARFYFYRKSDLNNRIDQTNTDRNNPTPLHGGTITLQPATGQDYEDFVVRETVAPDGYLRVTNDMTIRVYNSGRAEILDRDKFLGSSGQPLFNNLTVEGDHWWLPPETLADGTFQFTISVQNIAETSMKIKKVDAEDGSQVLAGAQFALADSEENAKAGKFLKLKTDQVEWNTSTKNPQYSWVAVDSVQDATVMTTGGDGLATFEHLDPRKTYYAVEIKAPAGYQLDQTPHALTKDSNASPVTVTNAKAGLFPRTGGMGMAVFVLAGLSLMGLALYGKTRYKPRH